MNGGSTGGMAEGAATKCPEDYPLGLVGVSARLPCRQLAFRLADGPGILAATILLADADAGSGSQPRRTLSYPEKQIIPLTPLSHDY